MNILSADENGLASAVNEILAGRPVVIPTETVYGIAADAASAEAVRRIYAVKGRDESVPLQVLVADLAMAETLALFNEAARALALAFCPGPVTLVMPRRKNVPLAPGISAGLDTIGIRIPDHPFARALIERLGRPLAASSANISGGKSPSLAEEAVRTLSSPSILVIDGGPAGLGLASTVIDCTADPPRILRAGAIKETDISAVLSALVNE